MSRPYEDILQLPHHVSEKHPRMPRSDRAAQFSPFAALSGYDDAVSETARLTSQRIELGEDSAESLNRKLLLILERPGRPYSVTVTHFLPDKTKSGGSYVETSGQVKKYDELTRTLMLSGGQQIPIDDIVQIDTEPENI